jgi:hypothetical protein
MRNSRHIFTPDCERRNDQTLACERAIYVGVFKDRSGIILWTSVGFNNTPVHPADLSSAEPNLESPIRAKKSQPQDMFRIVASAVCA